MASVRLPSTSIRPDQTFAQAASLALNSADHPVEAAPLAAAWAAATVLEVSCEELTPTYLVTV